MQYGERMTAALALLASLTLLADDWAPLVEPDLTELQIKAAEAKAKKARSAPATEEEQGASEEDAPTPPPLVVDQPVTPKDQLTPPPLVPVPPVEPPNTPLRKRETVRARPTTVNEDRWAEGGDDNSVGPTGWLSLGISGDNGDPVTASSVTFGVGVRVMQQDTPTALSVLVSMEFGRHGMAFGVPLRGELIARHDEHIVPHLRLGASLTPLAYSVPGQPMLLGARASAHLGWCLPAASKPEPKPAYESEGPNLSGLAALPLSGNLGAAGLVVIGALLIATPDLSVAYEVAATGFGPPRSTLYFSVGIGI